MKGISKIMEVVGDILVEIFWETLLGKYIEKRLWGYIWGNDSLGNIFGEIIW